MELKRFIIQQVDILMSNNGYTQEQMAHVLDLGSKAAFNKRILGKTAFKNEELVAIATEFKKDINYLVNPDYEQEQKEMLEMKEERARYDFGTFHDPTEKTITISVDIPISGGLSIPEDINERIMSMIKNNQ
jgi:transcriptional regulator with XRE-family HTH domain